MPDFTMSDAIEEALASADPDKPIIDTLSIYYDGLLDTTNLDKSVHFETSETLPTPPAGFAYVAGGYSGARRLECAGSNTSTNLAIATGFSVSRRRVKFAFRFSGLPASGYQYSNGVLIYNLAGGIIARVNFDINADGHGFVYFWDRGGSIPNATVRVANFLHWTAIEYDIDAVAGTAEYSVGQVPVGTVTGRDFGGADIWGYYAFYNS